MQRLIAHSDRLSKWANGASSLPDFASGVADNSHRMEAENLLLTHFSARYPKMPQSEAAPNASGSTDIRQPTLGIAFDLSRVRIGDMPKLNAYLPAIEQSFGLTAEVEEDEEIAQVMIAW